MIGLIEMRLADDPLLGATPLSMALSMRIVQLRVVIGVIPPVCGDSSRSS
jgi:hypothetical protein